MTMKKTKIAVLSGDGIGPEVIDQAIKVMDAIGDRFQRSVDIERDDHASSPPFPPGEPGSIRREAGSRTPRIATQALSDETGQGPSPKVGAILPSQEGAHPRTVTGSV